MNKFLKSIEDVLWFLDASFKARTARAWRFKEPTIQALSLRLRKDLSLDVPPEETLFGMLYKYGLLEDTEFAAEGIAILRKRLQKMLDAEWKKSVYPSHMIYFVGQIVSPEAARYLACLVAQACQYRVARAEKRPSLAIAAARRYAMNPTKANRDAMTMAYRECRDFVNEGGWWYSTTAGIAACHCSDDDHMVENAAISTEYAMSDDSEVFIERERQEEIEAYEQGRYPRPLEEIVPEQELNQWLADRLRIRIALADMIRDNTPRVDLRVAF